LRGETDFIESVVRVYDQRVFTAETAQYFRQRATQFRVENADDLAFDMSGIGERPENIEERAQAQILARLNRVFHCAVMIDGKHEADADLAHAAFDFRSGKIEAHAGAFQQISGTAFRGN